MNPELVLTTGALQYIALLAVGVSLVLGFLAGYLTKNFLIDRQLRDLENLLESKTGLTLDDYFKELY